MENIGLAIHDIRLLNWIAAGPFGRSDLGQLKLDLNTRIDSNPTEKAMQVVNAISFYYEKEPDEVVLSATVVTDYKLDLPESMVRDDGMDIPDPAVITMISIAISNARALFVDHAKSFGLQGFMIPLVNPTEIFNRLKNDLETKKESWE